MKREMRLYFVFFAITYFGSCLSAIATFLQIDRVFGSISYLGVALSLKTLFLVAGGIAAPPVILRLGLRRTLVLSQWAGAVFLVVLYSGFALRSFPLVLAGIFISSLPSLLLTVVCSSLYRLASDKPEDFRELQGTQAILGGMCFLIAGVSTPFLMRGIDFGAVLLLDAATYLVGVAFLSLRVSGWIEALDESGKVKPSSDVPITGAADPGSCSWSDPRVVQFAAALGATYLLIGIVPLVAISRQSLWSEVLRDVPQGIFWTIEALSALIGGWIYRSASKRAWLQAALALPIPIGLFLIPLVYSNSAWGVGCSLGALSLSMVLRFLKIRDDFMLQFESKEDTVRASARVSTVVHFLMFISPLILLPLIRQESQALLLIMVTLTVQCLLIVIGVLIQSDRARVHARKSLNEILLRLTSYSLISLGISLSAVLITGLYFSTSILYQRQVDSWVESFPRSVVPHLVDSDYLPLEGKVQLLQKTRVFKTFMVYDRSGELISFFGSLPKGRGLTGPVVKLPIVDEAGVQWGSFEYRADRSFYFRPFILISFIAAVLTVLTTVLARWLLRRKLKSEFDSFSIFLKEIEALGAVVAAAASSREVIRFPARAVADVTTEEAQINQVVAALINKIDEYQRAMTRIEIDKKRSEIAAEVAAQVAHDIRSPLAALEVAAGDASHLSEDKRILIRSAVSRIRDIANSQLAVSRTPIAVAPKEMTVVPHLLSSLLGPVVSEKRLQYRPMSRIEIELRFDSTANYGLFASVQPVEFKRVISNLVNNAVEAAVDGAGFVTVTLSARAGEALIAVQDDGKGIPAEVLAKLGRRGETHGKSGGSGLGLHHARASAESWGGRLEISSEAARGTTVTIRLPQARAPEWFVSELVLKDGEAVVILDDDASIHHVWNGRLDTFRAKGIEIFHASAPSELRSWSKDIARSARGVRYLLDYELLGHEETGLSLAEELGIGKQAILVTSRYEEPAIIERCRALGTLMIPKSLAGAVPVRIDASPAPVRWDAILIDDDELLRATWKIAASRMGKRLRHFATAGEFLDAADSVDRATPVYIDAELGNDVAGEVESLKIRELGFAEIYLATGHAPAKFAGLAHLRGVVGKEPPWA